MKRKAEDREQREWLDQEELHRKMYGLSRKYRDSYNSYKVEMREYLEQVGLSFTPVYGSMLVPYLPKPPKKPDPRLF